MLGSLTSENLAELEQAYQLSLTELTQFTLPAIEDQLLLRKFFCSNINASGKQDSSSFSLADLLIYHEMYTALEFAQISLDRSLFPNTHNWMSSMARETSICDQNKKLDRYINSQPILRNQRRARLTLDDEKENEEGDNGENEYYSSVTGDEQETTV